MGKERRKFIRLEKSVNIFYAPMARMHPPFTTLSKDISGEGIRIPIERGVKKGEVLELEIALPGEKSIFALGKVVWLKGKEAGIKFVNIEAEDKAQIFNAG